MFLSTFIDNGRFQFNKNTIRYPVCSFCLGMRTLRLNRKLRFFVFVKKKLFQGIIYIFFNRHTCVDQSGQGCTVHIYDAFSLLSHDLGVIHHKIFYFSNFMLVNPCLILKEQSLLPKLYSRGASKVKKWHFFGGPNLFLSKVVSSYCYSMHSKI